jgi:dTDP-4-dehydrorhamnose reductase
MKVLVLGDGLLGSEIVKQTGWDYISRKKDGFDIRNNTVYSQYKLFEYNIIVNCIADTNTYSNNKQSHWDINFKAVKSLAEYCDNRGIKLVHISSDYIYANSTTIPSEEDVPVHAENWYSYTKLLGDAVAQLVCENHLICRCTHKPKPWKYDTVWSNIKGNFDYVDVIAKLIIDLINKNVHGVINVGTETKTLFDLAKQTKEDITISDNFKQLSTPSNTEMNITKLNNLL